MKNDDIIRLSERDFENVIDSLGTGPIAGLSDMDTIVYELLNSLPKLNRDKLRNEMENMTVEVLPTPTTSSITEGLAKAQGFRDRCSEILLYATREAKLRRRCYDMLYSTICVTSNAKNNDARMGNFSLRYPTLIIQTEAAEMFVKEVEHVFNNLKSVTDVLSRQVSVMQLQLQLGEIKGRGNNSNGSDAEEMQNTNLRNFKSGTTTWEDLD